LPKTTSTYPIDGVDKFGYLSKAIFLLYVYDRHVRRIDEIEPEWQIFATVGTRGDSPYAFKDQKDSEKDYYVKQYIGFGILNIDITNNGRTPTDKFYANNNGKIINSSLLQSIYFSSVFHF
jgi:hypothetical protein